MVVSFTKGWPLTKVHEEKRFVLSGVVPTFGLNTFRRVLVSAWKFTIACCFSYNPLLISNTSGTHISTFSLETLLIIGPNCKHSWRLKRLRWS